MLDASSEFDLFALSMPLRMVYVFVEHRKRWWDVALDRQSF